MIKNSGLCEKSMEVNYSQDQTVRNLMLSAEKQTEAF